MPIPDFGGRSQTPSCRPSRTLARYSTKGVDQASLAVVEAFTAAALGQPAAALRHASAVLDYAAGPGFAVTTRGGPGRWLPAPRKDLADTATVRELLALLDGYPPGQLAPMQRAERDLARARLAAAGGDPDADPALAAAIAGLRQHSAPYHLAHGLIDQAAHLSQLGDEHAVAGAIEEAAGIARQLRCRPLLDRAETIRRAAGDSSAAGSGSSGS